MKNLVLVCVKLIVLSTSLYLFQMQLTSAINNRLDPPTVDSTLERNLTENDLPVITVCPTNQTDYAKLEELGYDFKTRMYAGLTNCTKDDGCIMSWGSQLNLTYQEFFEQIHNIKLTKDIFFLPKISEEKIVFLPRFGFCKEISIFHATQEPLMIFNKHAYTNIRVFLTDKTHRSYFSLDFASHLGDKIIAPWGKTFFTNVKTKKTSTCKIKEEVSQEFDYQNCVENNLQKMAGKILGCVPPWTSKTNQCTRPFPMNYKQANIIFWFAILLEQMRMTPVETECKTCVSTQHYISVKDELDSDESWGTNGNKSLRAIIYFDPTVTITETLYSYDNFKFLVDIGSSFGTWLGLSMLSINDLLTAVVEFMKNHDICRKFKSVSSK